MGLRKKKSEGPDHQQIIQDSLRKRDYGGAIAAFEALLKNSDSTQMRMRYADTLVLAGRKSDALAQFRRAAEEMAQQGQLVRAIATYKKIAKIDPSQADILENIARLNAERDTEQSVPAPAPPPAPAPAGGEMSFEFGMEEGDAVELDIGFGMAAMPSEPVAELELGNDVGVSDLAVNDVAGSDLGADLGADLAPDDIGADLSPDDLGADLGPDLAGLAEPEPAPESESAMDLLGAELAPDHAAEVEATAAPDPSAGLLGAELAPDHTAEVEATVAPGPTAGLGFDFGAGPAHDEAPAANESAGTPAGEGFGFSFGQPEPTPPASDVPASEPGGFGLSFDAPVDAASSVPTSEDLPASAVPPASDAVASSGGLNEVFPGAGMAMGDSGGLGGDANPFAGGGDGDDGDLLALLGDDIEMMIDGIISDVADDSTGGTADLGTMETNIRLFNHLAVDEFVEVLKLLDRQVVKSGQEIVRQGEPGASMYIICDGLVEAVVDRDGQAVKVASLTDGDFFGEMSVLTGAPRTATIRTEKDTELLVLTRDKLQSIFSRFPEIEAKVRLAHDERAEALGGS